MISTTSLEESSTTTGTTSRMMNTGVGVIVGVGVTDGVSVGV